MSGTPARVAGTTRRPSACPCSTPTSPRASPAPVAEPWAPRTRPRSSPALVTPIAAGYHFDEVNHLSLSLPIYVPTSAYNDNRLANARRNTYTSCPPWPSPISTARAASSPWKRAGVLHRKRRHGLSERRPLHSRRAVDPRFRQWLGRPYWRRVTSSRSMMTRGDGATSGFRGRSVGAGPVVGWTGKFADAQANFSTELGAGVRHQKSA